MNLSTFNSLKTTLSNSVSSRNSRPSGATGRHATLRTSCQGTDRRLRRLVHGLGSSTLPLVICYSVQAAGKGYAQLALIRPVCPVRNRGLQLGNASRLLTQVGQRHGEGS